MTSQFDLDQINTQIQAMKAAAENLCQHGETFPALHKNTRRILASIKMLEINVSDVIDQIR